MKLLNKSHLPKKLVREAICQYRGCFIKPLEIFIDNEKIFFARWNNLNLSAETHKIQNHGRKWSIIASNMEVTFPPPTFFFDVPVSEVPTKIIEVFYLFESLYGKIL